VGTPGSAAPLTVRTTPEKRVVVTGSASTVSVTVRVASSTPSLAATVNEYAPNSVAVGSNTRRPSPVNDPVGREPADRTAKLTASPSGSVAASARSKRAPGRS